MPFQLKSLDNRKFQDLVDEAKRRIPGYLPEWTDYNEGDPGITLIQLFAWLTEAAIFRLDQVPDDRVYAAFLNLLGHGPRPAIPAQAVVTLIPTPGTPARKIEPVEMPLRASGDDGDIPFEADESVPLVGATLFALLVDDGSGREWRNETDSNRGKGLEPFGDRRQGRRALHLGLYAGKTESLLGGPEHAEIQIYVEAREAAAVRPVASTFLAGQPAPARGDVQWEGKTGQGSTEADWTKLDVLLDDTNGLRRTGFLRLRLPATLVRGKQGKIDRDLFWIRAVTTASDPAPREVRQIAVNAARVRQLRTYRCELLFPGSDGTPNQRRVVLHPPILIEHERPPSLEVSEIVESSGEARWIPWALVADLATRCAARDQIEVPCCKESEPLQPACPDHAPHLGPPCTESEQQGAPRRIFRVSDDRSRIELGDGLDGMIPPRGRDNLRLTYRSGGGKAGNVAKGAIKLVGRVQGVDRVEQIVDAVGGDDEESVERALACAPERIRTAERAVTPRDFEVLARELAAVSRAEALNRRHPFYPGVRVTGALTLVVFPRRAADGTVPAAPQELLEEVAGALEPYRVVTTELYVIPARPREVSVTMEVEVAHDEDIGPVQRAVVEQLRCFLDPLTGGQEGKGWPLGDTVVLDQLRSRALCDRRVLSVISLKVELDGVERLGDLVLTSPVDVVAPGTFSVTARLRAPRRW